MLFTLRDSILVQAPIERCFLLSTSVEIVESELGMKPVAGRRSGFVEKGDTVRWEGWKLGFPQWHVSLITALEAPHFFQDQMIAGRFASFEHDHRFRETPQGVLLEDELRFRMPFGFAGDLVGRFILVPHIRGLMRRRFALLKCLAEGEDWKN